MLSYLGVLAVPAVLLRRACGLRFVGLTGGISSGKSSVSSYLRSRHSMALIDFDLISREVVQPGHWSGALAGIASAFGPQVLRADGTLDREALGKIIFNDASSRARLNGLMQTPIRKSFFWHVVQLTREGHREILLDVPLLFEAKLHLLCSETVVIYVDKEVQRERLMKRDSITSEVADGKIGAQWSLDRKAALADTVIRNNGSIEDLHHELDSWHQRHVDQRRQAWWREWVPTVPTLLIVAVASPLLLATNALARWLWL